MSAEIENIAAKRELMQRKASKAAATIHAADKAEDIARVVKDEAAVRAAQERKLRAQGEFYLCYSALFPNQIPGSRSPGPGRGHKQDDTSGVLFSPADAKRKAWCAGFGFGLRTVQRWKPFADQITFEGKNEEIFKRYWRLAQNEEVASFTSDSVEWYTPEKYILATRDVLGEIDLDPASSPQANAVVGAKKIFTAEQDGLKREWHGRVFMNPPYGKGDDGKSSLAGAFCNKAIREYEAGRVTECIILVNSVHSQQWQGPLYDFPVCFVDHRIKFEAGDGEINKSPTFQNIFVYLGKNKTRFAEVFSAVGYVMERM